MDFDDLVEEVAAPEKRAGKVADGVEHKMHDGAVMVAYRPRPAHGKCEVKLRRRGALLALQA